MKAVQYRNVRETEIAQTAEIFLIAVNDMYARHGINLAAPERAAIETGYRHIFETGIFQVAEVDGRIAAICNAVVRGPLWFLSGFWMLPQFQRQGLGGTLLKRVMAEGEASGARIFFTWSSVDQTAIATYMKQGMLPGYPILSFGGPLRESPSQQQPGYVVEPLDISHAMELDAQVRATSREADHGFWLSKAGQEGRQVVRGRRAIGYYYFKGGVIGPAAWSDAADGPAVMEAAFREASQGAEQLRVAIPGVNHTAIRFALASGLRLISFSHLLRSAPFGMMEQYLASGPLLF
ncbi:MAG TPA: GNAT family N-acetyltransferase [Pyrinomonadaceae bacterium]|jgi:GNAT superfamily N-acetyltransferase/ribosomal protein L34|nr:GNAT family N-acetyltransferase [Pyrinomonadaceae bacterium]